MGEKNELIIPQRHLNIIFLTIQVHPISDPGFIQLLHV